MRPFAIAARRLARPVVHLRPVPRAVLVAPLLAIAALTSPALASPALDQSPSLEPPIQPTGLTGLAAHDRVALTWDDPGDASISGYRVLRRDPEVDASGVFRVLVDHTGSALPAYADREVQPQQRYVYRVQARNGAGLSPRSRRFVADTPVTPVVRFERGVPGEQPVARAQHTCPGGEDSPEPEAVPLTAVPIVVTSTTAEYFVLYVSHDVDGATVDIPVSVKRGEADTTTLAENVAALPVERYRVEKYLIADPGDIDGDCTDDLTELNSLGQMNPVNPAPSVASSDGVVGIPDMATFESLARDNQGKFYVTYVQFGINTSRPRLYFVNTSRYLIYGDFMEAIGRISDPWTRAGTITYDPDLLAPNGSQGAFYFGIGAYADFLSLPARTHTLLSASMPLIDNNLVWHVENYRLPEMQSDLPWIRASRFGLVTDVDVRHDIAFLKLNAKEGYGRLQVATTGYRPSPLEIVIYETLPTTVPRIAGIISTTPQTPLSLPNLRALQSGVPNAVVNDALEEPSITSLVGSFVQYEVTEYGWVVRAATPEQAEAHYESSRPADTQTPARDLSLTEITALSDIGFNERSAFGVKAANVAVLRTLGLPSGTVPDGFAIPFYFCDEFMKTHNFYDRIEEMLADEEFQSDHDIQANKLQELRDDIEDSASPNFIIEALTAMHASFPEGTSLRYRPSTNNEDLPNFNGAGLYDSATQDTGSTAIDRSFKQVLASLWTYRAFTEREFHRIDHLSAAMGVLVHSSTSSERANGSAVSFDPVSDNADFYYLNVYPAQDQLTALVDRPSPEEWLLRNNDRHQILGSSNQVDSGTLLLNDNHLEQLWQHLESIHDHFRVLYTPGPDEPFAMEIEFKITSDNILSIKQARPWVFGGASTVVEPPVTPAVTVSFAARSYTVAEGESVPVVVSLSADPERTLTVPLTSVGQGGASSADHSSIPASVTFVSGVTSQMFDVSAAADGEVDAGESVAIGFGTLLAGVTVGATPATTVAITDSADPPVAPPVTVILGGGGGGGPSGPPPSEIDFEWNVTRDLEDLDRDHGDPTGMWSDGATLWLAENGDGADDAVYAYDLESGERVEDREFELDEANRAPRGIWSNGERAWVSDSGQERLFAYDLVAGERLPDSDLALHPDNDGPRGIWSDGSTMWVLDGRDNALFGYDFASGTLLAEYALDSDNDDPHGIWSDRVGVWVSDHNGKRLFAYRLPSLEGDTSEDAAEALELERVTDEEFKKLSSASNNSPRGIWSDGDVMYVADASDGKVYTYNVPDAIDARLASLSLRDVDIGEFSPSQPEYEGIVNEDTTATTVEAQAVQSGAEVAIDPPDADGDEANGHQVALESVSEITVTVTSADGSRTKVYLVRIGGAADAGEADATNATETTDAAAACLRGAVAVGFSLAVYEGGSIEELVACAEGRDVTALYALEGGEYVSYILGAPEFVNEDFRALFAEGVPSLTPLTVKSAGPATAASVVAGVIEPWVECLQGEVVQGFNLVLYEGGSVDELDACAVEAGVAALYILNDGIWVSYVLGAPEFVNRSFRELFTDGLPAATPLVGKRD